MINPRVAAVGTVAVIAADAGGIAAEYPALVVIFSATFGVAVGTIFWQLAQSRPTAKVGVIVGYLFLCNWIAWTTHDLTAAQVKDLIHIEYIARLWDLPPSTRYSLLSFVITQCTTGWQRLIHVRRLLAGGGGKAK